jgi:hypothetical protein
MQESDAAFYGPPGAAAFEMATSNFQNGVRVNFRSNFSHREN